MIPLQTGPHQTASTAPVSYGSPDAGTSTNSSNVPTSLALTALNKIRDGEKTGGSSAEEGAGGGKVEEFEGAANEEGSEEEKVKVQELPQLS